MLSTFLAVLFQSVLVLAALVLVVSTSACLLALVPLLFFAVLAVVVSVVGFVPALMLFLLLFFSVFRLGVHYFLVSVWIFLLM